MNIDKDTEEVLQQFASLTPEQQKRLCDTLVKDEVIQRFQAMPKEDQERIHGDLSDLFTQLRSDWEANPENANKTVTYTQLWNDHISKRKNGEQTGAGYVAQGATSPDP